MPRPLVSLVVLLLLTACASPDDTPDAPPPVPDWVHDAVFYQVFPERFANGDPSNDPTRETLEYPRSDVPDSWTVRPWGSDWYARSEWETDMEGGFYDSVYDRRYGGDLQGVIDRLPYLDSLGVNALYFNPVFWARSLHKYDGNSFHHVDPHFGPDPEGDFALMASESPEDPSTWTVTAADSLFFDLVARAHDRDMRVIIDGVFNHTGRDFFAFRDLAEKQQDSQFADWYIVESFDDPATPDTNEFAYEGWWGVESLPVFADTDDGTTLHPGPREYVFHATEKWMDPNGDGDPSDGIDGWRLDVAPEVPVGFWQEWHARVRALNPDAYTIAEEWEEASNFLERGRFTSTMNYFAFAFPAKGFLVDNAVPPSEFASMLDARRTAFGADRRPALLNLIDSHDTPRIASMLANRADTGYVHPDVFDYDRGEVSSPRGTPRYDVTAPEEDGRDLQQLVALFQMTYVGAPMIYYGTESGMWGADDPDDRKPMVWPDSTYAVEDAHPFGHDRDADPVRFDRDLFDAYQQLIALRTDHAALRRGDFGVLSADDTTRTFSYARTLDASALIVVMNRSNDAHSVRIPLPDSLQGTYEQVLATPLTGDTSAVRVQQDATALLLDLPARTGLTLRRRAN